MAQDDVSEQPTIREGRSAISLAYQKSVDLYRARGCRCTLRWDDTRGRAVPLTAADAIACSVDHNED